MNEAETSFNYFELNELKCKYGELEKDIRRLRIENTKKEKEIQKLREDIQKIIENHQIIHQQIIHGQMNL